MIVNIINSIDYLYIIHGYYNDVKVNQIRGYHMGDQEFLKAMGQRIGARRKALGMTQEALAEKLDVSPQMISNLELGKKAIRPENLAHVCAVLDLSADFVLTGSNHNTQLDAVTEKMVSLSHQELELVDQLVDYMTRRP